MNQTSQAAPSSRSLVRSVAVSVLLAGAILLVFVLPAEYGLDPVGAGQLLGIDGMSGYSVSSTVKADTL